MRGQLRIGSGLCWLTAWLFALAAPAATLLWPGDLTWWLGLALLLPLLGLTAWRQEAKGYTGGPHGIGVGEGGPFVPPP